MLWTCQACTTRYAESLEVCPHCGSADRVPQTEEESMPKNTIHGGASNADSEPEAVVELDGAAAAAGGETGEGGSAAAAPLTDPEPSGEVVTVNAGVAAGSGEALTTTDPDPVPGMLDLPADGSLKAEWVAYAEAHLGLTHDEADAMTKAALIELAHGQH